MYSEIYFNKNKKIVYNFEIKSHRKLYMNRMMNKFMKEYKVIKFSKEYKKEKQRLTKFLILFYRKKYNRDRYKSDNLFCLKQKIRTMMYDAMGRHNDIRTEDILGCTINDFKIYIESNFKSWMNWDNRGKYNGEFNYGWDIDHIKPLSMALNKDEIIILNHYTNLQPLCSKINRDIKKNKMEEDDSN